MSSIIRVSFVTAVALLGAATAVFADPWESIREIPAVEAVQAAASDGAVLYAINSRVIATYDRKSHQRIAVSTGDAKHLNSGFVFKGKLFCAHSNYPATPELSEIKVLDPANMRLRTFHSFGNYGGSLVWVVRRGEHWWCNFAKYGDENAKTFLVRFDAAWRETGRWTYPDSVIRQLGRYSLSGGVWYGDELLTTGHDRGEIYRLSIPETGTILRHLGTDKAPFTGQGIAKDQLSGGLIGISRAQRRIIVAGRPVKTEDSGL